MMTKNSRPIELAHQRCGELQKSVRQDHHLRFGPQRIQKIFRPFQWRQTANDLLNIRQFEIVLFQNI